MTKPSSHLQWLYGNPDIASRVETPTSERALNGYYPADIPTSKNFNFYLYTLDEWDKWAESELDLKAPLNSPSLVTPNLGTPSAGTLTNCSGLPLAGTTGTLPVNRGGTGATTNNDALNALLPSQASASGKVLTSNGTDASWASGLTSVLASASIFVGNASNVATAVAMSGVISLSNAGVTAFANGDFGSVAVKSSDSVTTPYLYGSSSASGTLELQSTSHGTKGAINFGASGAFGGISSAGVWALGKNGSISAQMITIGGTSYDSNLYDSIGISTIGTGTTARATIGGQAGGSQIWRVGSSREANLITGAVANDLCISVNGGTTWFSGDNGTSAHGKMTTAGAWLFGGSSMTSTPLTVRGYSTIRGSGSTADGEIKLGTNSVSGARIQHYDGGQTVTSIDNLNDDPASVWQVRMRTSSGSNIVTVLSATGAGAVTAGPSAGDNLSTVHSFRSGDASTGGAGARSVTIVRADCISGAPSTAALVVGNTSSQAGILHERGAQNYIWTRDVLNFVYTSANTIQNPVSGMTDYLNLGYVSTAGAWTLGPTTGAGSGTGTDALEHAVYGAINIKPQTSASSAGGSGQSHDFSGMSYVAGATYLVTISAYRSTNAADYAIWQQLAVEKTSGSFALFDVFPYASAGGVDLANIALSRSGSVITVSCDSSATSSGIVNMRVGLIRHG